MCKKLESKSKQTFVVFVAPWFFFTLYHFAVQSTIPLSNIVFGFVSFRVKKHKPLVLSETSGNLESTLSEVWCEYIESWPNNLPGVRMEIISSPVIEFLQQRSWANKCIPKFLIHFLISKHESKMHTLIQVPCTNEHRLCRFYLQRDLCATEEPRRISNLIRS